MTILLANTWSASPISSDAVPRYLDAFVSALLVPTYGSQHGRRVRFLIRRTDDMYALRAAIPALTSNDGWEAAVVDRLDDASTVGRALRNATAVFWADDGKDVSLAREGKLLLETAAEVGVRRFVYRSQIQSRLGSKGARDALDL
jgi:hypothetical protein